MIKVSHLFIFIIFSRLVIDLIFVNEKPLLVQGLYIFLVLVFCAVVLANNQVREARWLFLLFIISMWTVYRSDNAIFDQLLHNVKIMLVALFLLCVPYTRFNIGSSLDLFRKFAVYIAAIGFLYTVVSSDTDTLTFDNNPMHSVSQIVAKTALAYIGNPPQYILFFVYMLYHLNVRSNFIPISLVAIAYFSSVINNKLAKCFIVAISIATSAVLFLNGYFDSFVKRVVFRGKEDMDLYTASSGRDEIFSYYISYIAENFTFMDYLLGRGSPALRGELIFSTHSDFLGIFVNFGLLGLLLSFIIYAYIFRSVTGKYKLLIIFYFVFVALTNGVIFHQSTILLALFCANRFGELSYNSNIENNKNLARKNF